MEGCWDDRTVKDHFPVKETLRRIAGEIAAVHVASFVDDVPEEEWYWNRYLEESLIFRVAHSYEAFRTAISNALAVEMWERRKTGA